MKKDESCEQVSRSRQKIFRITKISLLLLFVVTFQARANLISRDQILEESLPF